MEPTNDLRAVREELSALRDDIARINNPTEYLTSKQTAEVLNLSVDVLNNWRRERRGPNFIQSSSRFVRYRRSDVDVWAGENLVET